MARCLALSVASFSVACCGAHAASSLDSVRSLIEKRSGSNLALRSVLSRLSSTDMDSTMEALMLDINRNIVSRIKLDHRETQHEIASVTNAIHQGERLTIQKKTEADKKGEAWKTCVESEKICVVGYEKTVAELITTQSNLDAAQTAFDAVTHVTASPSMSEFKIDFLIDGHSSESVASKLNMYKQEMTTMKSAVGLERERMHTDFAAARASLETATRKHARKTRRANQQKTRCQNKRGSCADKRGKRVVSMCAFGDKLNEKCEAVRSYADLMTKVDAVDGDEFSHVDRVNEWNVVQTALCLVRLLKESATINEASLSTCEAEAMSSFETEIGVLDRKSGTVNDLTVSSEFSCDAKTVTFGGGNYNLAVCGDETCPSQTSTDFTWSDNYSPAITIGDDDAEPFEFCE